MNRDNELSRIFKARINQWQWDAKPVENKAGPTGDFDLSKVLRGTLNQAIRIEGVFAPFDYSVPPPEGATWSVGPIPGKFVVDSDTQQVVYDAYVSSAKPVTNPLDGITSPDDYIAWITPQLPPPLDSTPGRANQWTHDRIHKALPTAKQSGILPWRGFVIEVDASLPGGVIMVGDKVLCNIKEDGE